MPTIHYDNINDALQGANDRIDVALERAVRYEAQLNAHFGLLVALVSTHPDLEALRGSWQRTRSVSIANSKIHDPDDAAGLVLAEETSYQCNLISEMLDGMIADDREGD